MNSTNTSDSNGSKSYFVNFNQDSTSRLVVCLEESLYIHNIRDMKVLHTIRDTPPNPQGLCALSINSGDCFLAYPGSSTIGEVQIFDAINLGTVIRVFSSTDASKLYEFRRGMKRCVAISCLAFAPCGQFLGCSSNTETVHVFKLEEPKDSPRRSVEESSWMGYLTNYLPTQVTDVFNQGRAFATAHLPFSGVRNVISIALIQQQLKLLVATEDGFLYVYNMDPNEGGDLVLCKQHKLDGIPTEASPKGTDKPDGAAKHSAPQSIETESEKFREMAAATESPPKGAFHFTDDQEYPPLTQNSD
nr:unnamed protein product [Callosobruchus analis]